MQETKIVSVPSVMNWLLEENTPGVRVRTLIGVCGLSYDDAAVQAACGLVTQTLTTARDLAWMENNGLPLLYPLVALAECGLTREWLPLDPAVDKLLQGKFDAGCGDMLALRALVMLGYARDERVQQRLAQVGTAQLPDGGWLCLHRLNKLKHIPKSCIKAAMHGLLLASELTKQSQPCPWSATLVDYFTRRRLFYRTDAPEQLVLPYRPGWRMTDIFMPAEVQRVGLPQLIEALAVLGAANRPEIADAWELLASKTDSLGRVTLEGTLVKPYLPRESVGKPSKWATLYALLARQGCDAPTFPNA